MHKFASFNREIVAAQSVVISAVSSAALYAKGVFTTIAIHNKEPFLWKKHWQRLASNAYKLKIDLAEFPETATKDLLTELLQENGVSNGRARITFFDESGSDIWPGGTERATRLLINTGELRPVSKIFRLTVSAYQINSLSPLVGIKSCNYLENLMALDEAKARGFDEAIMFNERGEVTSAVMANVFWLMDDVLHTPSLRTGCLAGTTREFVLKNVDCREVEVGMDELGKAEAIFLTSAGLGVAQAAKFESTTFKKIDHPILDLLPKR